MDMDVHSAEKWISLYACSIRCALQPCNGGFAFLLWQSTYCDGKKMVHATLLYLNIRLKIQVFFDPSGAVGDDMLEFMSQNHLWETMYDDPTVVVIDHHKPGLSNLQAFFESCMAWCSSPNHPCAQKPVYAAGGGCCTTVVILVACICLRFGTFDIQFVVDLLRDEFIQQTQRNVAKLHELFVDLRQWQENFIDADHDTMLHLLGILRPIEKVSNDDRCNAFVYKKDEKSWPRYTLCQNKFIRDDARQLVYTWCAEHKSKHPLEFDRPFRERKRYPMHMLPPMLSDEIVPKINVCVFVEDRGVHTKQWKCALATAISQASRFQYEERSTSSFAAVRFYGFGEETEDKVKQMWNDMVGLLNLLQGIDILCIQRLNNDHIDEFTNELPVDTAFLNATIQYVNKWTWHTVMVYNRNLLLYVSFDFRREQRITVQMNKLLHAVNEHLQNAPPVLFRFVFSTRPQMDWFEKFMFDAEVISNTRGLHHCLMHFVIQPNLLVWKTRVAPLLYCIKHSWKPDNQSWMERVPVQIVEGYVTQGYHGYITMPDSTPEKMKVIQLTEGSPYTILCDSRILPN